MLLAQPGRAIHRHNYETAPPYNTDLPPVDPVKRGAVDEGGRETPWIIRREKKGPTFGTASVRFARKIEPIGKLAYVTLWTSSRDEAVPVSVETAEKVESFYLGRANVGTITHEKI